MSLSLNLESIILLLFFIAPGFMFTRTYTAYRPRYYREPTAFEQFVLAIVGSTIIHAAIFTIIAVGILINWSFSGQMLYLNNIINPTSSFTNYALPVIALFLFAGIIYLAVSMVMARRMASLLGRTTTVDRPRWWNFIFGEDPPEPFLLWHTILQIEPLRMNLIPPQLIIQMRNGEYFEGDLYRLRLVGDEENTVELALRNVSHRPALSGQKEHSNIEMFSQALQPLTNRVVLLRSIDILWLARNDRA